MATSFSGGRSRSTRREPPTMGKQLVSFITCTFFVIYKAGREPTPLLVIGLYELLGNPTTSLTEPPGPHRIHHRIEVVQLIIIRLQLKLVLISAQSRHFTCRKIYISRKNMHLGWREKVLGMVHYMSNLNNHKNL
jgi:hypothetical protein